MIADFLRKIVSVFKKIGLHRIGFFRVISDKLRKIRLPFSVSIQGFRMQNLKLYTYLAGVHEPGTTALCKKVIQQGWTVLDLGAGDGYFTVLFSRLVGPKGKVFVFEPDNANVTNIRANVARNCCTNVVIVPKAVSDHTGKTPFFSAYTKGTGSLFYESPGGGNWINVDIISLDDYFKDYAGRINFFKMDIEGGEAGAFSGMKNILSGSKAADKLCGVIELSPHLLDSIGVSSADFLRLVRGYGFKLHAIDGNGNISELSDAALIGMARQSRHINIFVHT